MGMFGTVLLGAIGTAVGTFFQNRTEEKAIRTDRRKRELESANTIFTYLSKKMDQLLYHMWQVFNAFKHKAKDTEKKKKWDAYTEVYREWEGTLNLKFAEILQYFGPGMEKDFKEIWGSYIGLRKQLDQLYYHNADIDFENEESPPLFVKIAVELGYDIRNFNKEMLRMMQEEKVGILRNVEKKKGFFGF